VLDTLRIVGPWCCVSSLPPGATATIQHGIRVKFATSGSALRWAECSLPRLLWGHNGRVIENQAQLDAALEMLRSCLADYAEVGPIEDMKATRVDLAWNFSPPALPIIMAHGGVRVPRIRGGPTRHSDDTGISWGRGRCACSVKLYDKSRQMRRPGSVLRAEVMLVRNRLHEEFASSSHWRDWNQCYKVFRRIMGSIPPIVAPANASTLAEAVAQEPKEYWEKILSRLAHTKSPRSLRRYRRLFAIAAFAPAEMFSWHTLLGAASPPPSVHVTPRPNRRAEAPLQAVGQYLAPSFLALHATRALEACAGFEDTNNTTKCQHRNYQPRQPPT
jgi:hypothetical protein